MGDEYRYLAVAVITQAINDAAGGDDRAMDWLLTTGLAWADVVGIYLTPATMRRRVQSMRG